jgi:glycosyltransferase involved in cell wall biosynthesis
MTGPLVTVVIPTHGRPALLCEALESVTAQTHENLEIIVVSNGDMVSDRYLAKHLCEAVGAHLIVLEEANVSKARNAGVAAAYGEWIAFLDDDDLWHPEKLERQLAATGFADILFTGHTVQFADGRELDCADVVELPDVEVELMRGRGCTTIQWGLMRGNWSGHTSTMLVRRTLALKHPFDPRFLFAEDWDCWRRMSHEALVSHVPLALATIRRHDSNVTSPGAMGPIMWYAFCARLKMFTDTPPRLWWVLPLVAFDLVAEPLGQACVLAYQAVDRLTGGRSGRAWRNLKGAFS